MVMQVDVVFEEDKGFLAAIANFMETTKRPIILTTSSKCDDNLKEKID